MNEEKCYDCQLLYFLKSNRQKFQVCQRPFLETLLLSKTESVIFWKKIFKVVGCQKNVGFNTYN